MQHRQPGRKFAHHLRRKGKLLLFPRRAQETVTAALGDIRSPWGEQFHIATWFYQKKKVGANLDARIILPPTKPEFRIPDARERVRMAPFSRTNGPDFEPKAILQCMHTPDL